MAGCTNDGSGNVTCASFTATAGGPSILTTQAAPSSNPSSGTLFEWGDLTNNILKIKDSSGNVSQTYRNQSCSAGQHLSAANPDGTLSCTADSGGSSAPTYNNIAASPMLGSLSGIVTEFSYSSLRDSTTYTANTVVCFELFMPNFNETVGHFATWPKGGNTAGKDSAVGVYDSSGNRLVQGVWSATGGSGAFTPFASSYTLTANTMYYVCAASEEAGTQVVFKGLLADVYTLYAMNQNGQKRMVTAANAASGTGGAFTLPATLGTLTTLTDADKTFWIGLIP